MIVIFDQIHLVLNLLAFATDNHLIDFNQTSVKSRSVSLL